MHCLERKKERETKKEKAALTLHFSLPLGRMHNSAPSKIVKTSVGFQRQDRAFGLGLPCAMPVAKRERFPMVTEVFSVASPCCVKICSLNALVRRPTLAKLNSFSLVANYKLPDSQAIW